MSSDQHISSDHHIVARLRAAGCVFAEDETAVLLAAAADPAELESMVERRVAGLPLEQIVGWAGFCGLEIIIEPGVFVPQAAHRIPGLAGGPAGRRGARGRRPVLRLGGDRGRADRRPPRAGTLRVRCRPGRRPLCTAQPSTRDSGGR